MARPLVALAVYTVRDEAEKDFIGTIKRITRIGYEGIEIGDVYGVKASELKNLLDSLGLKVAGRHIGIDILEKDLEATIEYDLEIGNKNIVCPFLPKERRSDTSGWKRVAGELNSIGEKLKKSNLVFSYHSHNFEFEKFDGKYGLDILMESTNPENLKWEIDVFWAKYAGVEPVEFLNKYRDRIHLVHLKDMESDGKTFAEVGEGVIDFNTIFEVSERGKVEWYIVEQDICKRPSLESARISFENLKKWGKV